MYLILKERAANFRSDPRVKAAMKDSHIPDLEVATLESNETWRDLANDSFDAESAGARSYNYEALDQLAMEHLMGVTN
jgi:xylose isomerase